MIKSVYFFIFFSQMMFLTSFGNTGFLRAQSTKINNSSSYKSAQNLPEITAEKCGQTILESQLETALGFFGSKPFFEGWVDQKLEEGRNQPQILSTYNQERRFIPVVVHVIHSGQAIGTGGNIPFSQIEAQINILNEDFRRQNSDASLTLAEFQAVAADSNIEFVLAKQDPQGLPTDGVVRIKGSKSSYSPSDAELIGQISQWNPEEYLNIWVTTLSNNYIGYASFPLSDLPGLNFSPFADFVDGVTIDYNFFGLGGNATMNSKGRTATHEIGHYLGLRHIWGDGGCGVDDFVADTPPQDGANFICSSTTSKTSCGNLNMIQNYMDYTPDACMNLFTKGQIDRFNVVLANSPRRVTLINNRATKNPILKQRDLAITRIIEPEAFSCSDEITPIIEVKNLGVLPLESAKILLFKDGKLLEEQRFSLSINNGSSAQIIFKSIPILKGKNDFEFRIVEINDLPNEGLSNNIKKISSTLQEEIQLPYTFDIAGNGQSWSVRNPDDLYTWDTTKLIISGEEENLFFLRNFDYDAQGQQDFLISPTLDLSKYVSPQLVFDLSYSKYIQSGNQDELMVAISQDCGNTFDFENATYQKFGELLDTSEGSIQEFIPTRNEQFRKELVNLKKFANLGKIKIAFVSKTGNGNNLYLKNIQIFPEEIFEYNLKINEIVSPTPVLAGTQEVETIRVTNTGNLPISQFFVSQNTNASVKPTRIFKEKTILPGEAILVQSPKTTINGKNRLDYRVFWPNADQNQGDSGSSIRRYIIENEIKINTPWRQKFDNSQVFFPWIAINPELDQGGWLISTTGMGTPSSFLAMLANQKLDNTYWLSSPIFDTSQRSQASVFFDLAVGEVSPTTALKLLVSDDAGETYSTAWIRSGRALSTISSGQANPNSSGDFVRYYVNLSSIAGKGKNKSRIAFVVEGGRESDAPIYLDNLEFFQNSNPEPVIPSEGKFVLYPNPATDVFNIAFNLPAFEIISIQIISRRGEVIQESKFSQTLNQTYSFSTSLFNRGLYLIRISSNSIQETRKIVIL